MSIVFCLLSVAIEWAAVRMLFRKADHAAVRRWAWKANLASYCGLSCFVVICMYVPTGALSRIADPAIRFVIIQAWKLAGGGDL